MVYSQHFFFFFYLVILGAELGAVSMYGNHPTTNAHPQTLSTFPSSFTCIIILHYNHVHGSKWGVWGQSTYKDLTI